MFNDEQERAFSLLQRSAFFSSVEPRLLLELPRMASFMEAPQGAVVFRQGDGPENFWMVTRGEAPASKKA